MVKLICYKKPNRDSLPISETAASSIPISEIETRLQLLKEICDGQANEVQQLESCIRKEFNARTLV